MLKFLKDVDRPLPKLREMYELVKGITSELKEADGIDALQTHSYLETNHDFERIFSLKRELNDKQIF